MHGTSLRVLSEAEVIAADGLDFGLAVRDIVDVLSLMRTGEAAMVEEAVLALGADPREKAYALPGRVGGRFGAAGVKWALHRHAERTGAAIRSVTLLDDLATGAPKAVVDSALLTAVRTASVSALALRHLSSGSLQRVALIGAGAQARAHLAMLDALFPDVEAVRVWNRTPARADAMCAQSPAAARLAVTASLDEAVADADAVVAATAAAEPLLGADVARPGRLVLQIGYHEVAFDAIDAFDCVTVDLWGDFCRTSAKSLFQMHRAGRFPPERVAADLAAIVLDGWRPPTGASVYFSSFGLNVFDIALAARVADTAAQRGGGATIPFSPTTKGSDPWHR